MQSIVSPSAISGTITAPASKSSMQRACAAALVKGGITILTNPGISADDMAALDIIQQLGATVRKMDDKVMIESKGIHATGNKIDCGESGLSVRMFTSIAALSPAALTITGRGSLLKRPLDFFNQVLPQLGVECSGNDGKLPLNIKGPLQPGDIEVDGSLSSQFLTGLLFAYSAAGARERTIRVKNLNSKPYIDLTLQVMADFGLNTPVNNRYEEFYFGRQSIASFANDTLHYTVEGDWSGGAFLLVAGAIAGNITVKGLDIFSTQADKVILDALKQAGTVLTITDTGIEVEKTELKSFHFNATDCPDLFPPLVALATFCKGSSVIEGVNRLAHKESNRALTLQEEFGKMGVPVELSGDRMIIKGTGTVKSARVHSHHDHRIAMACAVAGLRAEGDIVIEEAEAINKSYPQFWQHLKELNAGVTLKNN